MPIATESPTVRQLLERAQQEEHFFVQDIDWNTYTQFVDGLGRRRVFVTYDRGCLEFMTRSHRYGGRSKESNADER